MTKNLSVERYVSTGDSSSLLWLKKTFKFDLYNLHAVLLRVTMTSQSLVTQTKKRLLSKKDQKQTFGEKKTFPLKPKIYIIKQMKF